MPCKKLVVPSIGSIIQILFLSEFFISPISSLSIENFAERNYFTHLAGKTNFEKVPDLNKKFGFK